MRRSLVTTALVMAAGALYFVGCTDSTRVPTEPPSFKRGGVPAPQARINALIRDAFSSKADRDDAQRQMARIKNALARGDVAGGQALTLALMDLVRENGDDINAAADLTAELMAFAQISGTAGVVGSEGGFLVSNDEQAAVDIPEDALSGDVLISFFKKDQPCFPVSEIPVAEQADDCYTFEPGGQVFVVDVRFEVCLDELDPNVDDVRLHGRDADGPPEVLVEENHELIDCEGFPKFIASTGSSGIERLARAGLNRLISLFSPEPLFAANAFILRRLGGTRGSFTDIGWALPQVPDLIIESIEVSPTNPTDEEALSFTVRVKNIGTVAADASKVRLTVKEAESESFEVDEVRDVSALDPGESVGIVIDSYDCEVSCDIFLSPDDYVASATADDDDGIDEADENNNTEELDFTVAPSGGGLPDLIVSSLEVPSTLYAGQSFSFTYELSNIGGVAPSSEWDVATYLSTNNTLGSGDRELSGGYSAWTYDLTVGWSISYTDQALIPDTVTDGTYYLIVVVDARPGQQYEGVDESNEDNNTLASAFQVVTPSE